MVKYESYNVINFPCEMIKKDKGQKNRLRYS